MKIYGKNSCEDPLSEFFGNCAREMDSNPNSEHRHFRECPGTAGEAGGLVVFKA
jgi:hypothetical protein